MREWLLRKSGMRIRSSSEARRFPEIFIALLELNNVQVFGRSVELMLVCVGEISSSGVLEELVWARCLREKMKGKFLFSDVLSVLR